MRKILKIEDIWGSKYQGDSTDLYIISNESHIQKLWIFNLEGLRQTLYLLERFEEPTYQKISMPISCSSEFKNRTKLLNYKAMKFGLLLGNHCL